MRWVLPLFLLGCTLEKDPDSGTFVGNPGKMDVTVVDVHEDLQLAAADVQVDSIRLFACDGSSGRYDLDVLLDALSPDGVEIVGGDFCGAELTLTSSYGVRVQGVTTAGTLFTVFATDPEPLQVADGFRVDGTDVLWTVSLQNLTAADIDALGPTEVIVGPGDPLSTAVFAGAAELAALYEDVDANGLLDDSDFLLGAYDPYGITADAAAKADAGCGCHSGSGPVGPALFLVALVTLSRRKRR